MKEYLLYSISATETESCQLPAGLDRNGTEARMGAGPVPGFLGAVGRVGLCLAKLDWIRGSLGCRVFFLNFQAP